MAIIKMASEHKSDVLDMMRVFYASEAVLSNGSEGIFESDLNACIGENPYAEGYVFETEGEIAGYAMLAKSFSTEFGRQCIWIEDIYIRPPFRGRKIARSFFDLLFASYPNAVFRLEAEASNHSAVAVYKKCGFDVLPYMEMIKK